MQDTGLVADHNGSFYSVKQGTNFLMNYGSERVFINCLKEKLDVRGIILTDLGESVASFCNRSTSVLGKEIFDAWINSLNKEVYPNSKLGS